MRAAVLLLLPLIAACAPDPASDTGNAADMARPSPDQSRLAIAPLGLGSWYFLEMGDQSAALFGPPGGAPVFVIRCDVQAGQVQFLRERKRFGGGGAATMTLVAQGGEIALPVQPAPGNPEQLAASLPLGAPFVALLARGPTRLAVTIDSGKPVTMPGDPVVRRALRDCA